MRKPKLERFDPKPRIQPEAVDLSGAPVIQEHPGKGRHHQASPLPENPPSTQPEATPTVPTNEATMERSVERTKVRHTFDVFQDQLLVLRRIQVERGERLKRRYLLGDLVQEALDQFIAEERRNERPVERTNGRSL